MTSRSDQPALDAFAEALLDSRAKRLSSPIVADEVEHTVPVAEFALGALRCAFPLANMRAALPLRLVTPVPLAQPNVIGVLRFEGQIITANSLAIVLDQHSWQRDPAVLLVVETSNGALAAFDCEQVPRTTEVPARLMAAADSASEASGVREVLLPDGKALHVLDVDVLQRRATQEGAHES